MATQRDYAYPVWGTQGGGLVRLVGDQYIFVTKPDCPGYDVGDDMPKEWGLIPANNLATQEMQRREFGEDEAEAEYWAAYEKAMADYIHSGHRS